MSISILWNSAVSSLRKDGNALEHRELARPTCAERSVDHYRWTMTEVLDMDRHRVDRVLVMAAKNPPPEAS